MMSNLAMKLDTLSYANRLIAAGCERKLAEAHASIQQDTLVEISEDYLSQFVTKKDLEHAIGSVKSELEHKIDSVEQRLEAKIDSVEQKLEAKIDSVEQKLEAKIDSLKSKLESKIDALGMKLTIRLGGIMMTGIIILETLARLHL